MDGEVIGAGPAHVDQGVSGVDEVVKDVLLVGEAPGVMPVAAIGRPAAQIGDGVHPAHLHPLQAPHVKVRTARDGEAAIAINQCRAHAIGVHIAVMGHEQRNARPARALIEGLADHIIIGVEGQVRRAKHRALARHHIIAIERRRLIQAFIGIKRLGSFRGAAKARGHAQARQLHFANERAVRRIDADRTRHIAHGLNDQVSAHMVRPCDRTVAFGHHIREGFRV